MKRGVRANLMVTGGSGLASYDRLLTAIQHQGRETLLRTLHHARQKANAWHPNVEALHLAVTSRMGCDLSRREYQAASGALGWLMVWVDGWEGHTRPEAVLLLLRRTMAGWLWLIARCVEETASVAEADLWFLQRMYRLSSPADPQLPRFLTKAPGFDLEAGKDGSRSRRPARVDGRGRASPAA